ncbi:hypothetical protein L3Y34_009168 [Caenorhabditis briggsae]|uniref:Uncharacterized protein n=1 Tax=Caenorhabditis briggsae TaxID=6238 RepID=A0AAE9A9J8_CAEBR|nr:hypothetical protein L3Y34_009168 [Caenorhabditis briggsae]
MTDPGVTFLPKTDNSITEQPNLDSVVPVTNERPIDVPQGQLPKDPKDSVCACCRPCLNLCSAISICGL